MEYTINHNEAFKSIEIAFDGKPSEAVRDALKALRYRWHNVKKIWYGYSDEETVRKAIDNATTTKKATTTAPATEKANKYGVKVGDVFYLNWGYEQTNVDFFQVVALVGEASVRVRHVLPEVVKTDACGPMCADYTYRIVPELMRADTCTVFIKDSEKGDLKRVAKSKYSDNPYIKVGDHFAHKIPFGNRTEYVSWYA